ncbi:hypothetical protein HPB47_012437 [Ixodes persulcatus]|uniref:Uncharacterized protein n=1 Tax=Ixodes persulcatus TaxID=34615 RepID=A0AC60NTH9_IXOPE|nr:hypothetical protein HPB47_012437 [Ixodes persulcatus]
MSRPPNCIWEQGGRAARPKSERRRRARRESRRRRAREHGAFRRRGERRRQQQQQRRLQAGTTFPRLPRGVTSVLSKPRRAAVLSLLGHLPPPFEANNWVSCRVVGRR